jgi:FKBP-type peptidyl-prolyl cis-trans isomerase SlyD
MAQPTQIEDDVVVTMAYTLKLDDGELVDEATADDPLIFLQGMGDIIPGLEEALYGLKVGETKTVVVAPEEGYGEYEEDAYEMLPHDLFKGVPLEVGLAIELRDKDSEEVYEVFVAEVSKEGVLVDFNHPLAGETLNFEVKILELREATEEELDHGHVHFEGWEDDEDDEDDEE